jgi:hypothetical protein
MRAHEAETLRLARSYAALGWSVVPVRPGEKLPAVPWAQYQRAPASDGSLEDWFGSGGYGIGLVQGAVSNTLVLDFDGELGQQTKRALEAQHGPFPPSPVALTPGGGEHVILRHPGRPVPTRKAVLPGMDVRGDGGFIVAHPSVHANGRRYEWDCDFHPDETAISDAPQWVVDLVCGSVVGNAADTPVIHTLRAGALGMPEAVVSDGREQYMRDTILAVLRDMRDWLQRLPTADELFEHVWPQYSARVDLTRPGRGADEVKRKCEYTLKRVSAGLVAGVSAEPGAAKVEAAAPKPERALRKIRLLTIAELESMPDPTWLVEGLIPDRGLVVPFGPPKKGKTFIKLSMCLHIADGRDWMGRKVARGGVVYIVGEGVGGFKLRVKAMRAHYGISDRIPFFVVPEAVNFSKPGIVKELVEAIREHVLDEPISLVVIDTLARAMPGVDENSSQEVGLVIAACDELGASMGCTVAPIHHSGKDIAKGLRGTSAIHGAVDAAYSITTKDDILRAGSVLILTPTDQKDADPGPPMHFDMIEVAVGIGRSSLVPVLRDGPIGDLQSSPSSRLTTQESLAMRALTTALIDHRAFVTGNANVPGNVPACTDENWREAFRKLKAGESWESARKTFKRVSESLINKNFVGCSTPYVWKVTDDDDMH